MTTEAETAVTEQAATSATTTQERRIAPLLGDDGVEDTRSAQATTEIAQTQTQTKAETQQATTETAAVEQEQADDGQADWRKAALDAAAALPDDSRKTAEALIKRYGSLSGMIKGLADKENLIRSGRLKRDMPDPSDEKAVAEWRKEQGIPEAPEKYKAPEISGFEWTPEDKPIMASFFAKAHEAGLPQSAANVALEWYADFQQQIAEKAIAADTEARINAEESLRREFGPEYRGNMTLAQRFLDTLPVPRAELMDARLPDGRRLGNVPEFALWAVEQARNTYGDAAFVTGESTSKFEGELSELENLLKADYAKYMADPRNQKRHLELLELDRKRQARR